MQRISQTQPPQNIGQQANPLNETNKFICFISSISSVNHSALSSQNTLKKFLQQLKQRSEGGIWEKQICRLLITQSGQLSFNLESQTSKQVKVICNKVDQLVTENNLLRQQFEKINIKLTNYETRISNLENKINNIEQKALELDIQPRTLQKMSLGFDQFDKRLSELQKAVKAPVKNLLREPIESIKPSQNLNEQYPKDDSIQQLNKRRKQELESFKNVYPRKYTQPVCVSQKNKNPKKGASCKDKSSASARQFLTRLKCNTSMQKK